MFKQVAFNGQKPINGAAVHHDQSEPARKEFTAKKLRHLDAISMAGVSSPAFHLAYHLSRLLNPRTGEAVAYQKYLGGLIGRTDRQVRTLLKELAPHWEVIPGKGQYGACKFRPIWGQTGSPLPASDHPDRKYTSAQAGSPLPTRLPFTRYP